MSDFVDDAIEQLVLRQRRNGFHGVGWTPIIPGQCALCGVRKMPSLEAKLLLEMVESLRMICSVLEDTLPHEPRCAVRDAEQRLQRAVVRFKSEGGAE